MLDKLTDGLVKRLLSPINGSAIILLGLFTVIWGIWVANPWWSVFTEAPLYHLLGAVAPEWFWGIVAIIAGCITTYGVMSRRYRPLIIGALVASWHWAMISIFFILGDFQNTGGITAALLSIYAAYVYLNIRINFKNSQNKPKKVTVKTFIPPDDDDNFALKK